MISKSNIIWFSVFGFFILVALGFYLVRIHPVMRETQELSQELDRKIRERRDLVSRPEGPPSEELLEVAKEETVATEQMLVEIKERFDIQAPDVLPEGITRQSIYWLDTLRAKREEIQERAEEAGLELEPGLGFGDELPAEYEVPQLLFMLYVSEELFDIAAGSGLRFMSPVEFVEAEQRRDDFGVGLRPRDDFEPRVGREATEERLVAGEDVSGLEDLNVRTVMLGFSVEGGLEEIFGFINNLRDGTFLYVVEDMQMEAVEHERTVTREIGDAPARRRDPYMSPEMMDDPYFDPEFMMPGDREREETVIERFLRVNMMVPMFYIPTEEDPLDPEAMDIPEEVLEEPEEMPDDIPDDIPDDVIF